MQRFKREGTYVYLWLIPVAIWQKPTQHCKATILQLKRNKFLKEREKGLQQAHKGEIGGGWREGTSTRGKIPNFLLLRLLWVHFLSPNHGPIPAMNCKSGQLRKHKSLFQDDTGVDRTGPEMICFIFLLEQRFSDTASYGQLGGVQKVKVTESCLIMH